GGLFRRFVRAMLLPPRSTSELNGLANPCGARLLEHVVCRGEVLCRDPQGLVERHVARRLTSRLRAVSDLADLGQNVLGSDGPGVERSQVLTAFIDGRF